MARYHYDADGNYKGRTLKAGERLGEWVGRVVFGLGAVLLALYWIWQTVTGYAALAPPYRWFAAYYYFVLVVPVSAASSVAGWFMDATRWRNLNSILAVASFLAVWMPPYVLAALAFRRLPRARVVIWSLALGPLLASIIWFAVSSIFRWLFAP